MSDVTRSLDAVERGEPQVAEELLPLVHEELRRLAVAKMADGRYADRPGNSFTPSEYVPGGNERFGLPDLAVQAYEWMLMDPQSQDAPQPEQVAAFFQKQRTGLVTLVFTDLVDSTALMQTMGDQAGAAFLQHRRQIIRDTLKAFAEGEEIETAGDSFLIVFSKPSDAVRFSLLLQRRFPSVTTAGAATVQERIGIHLGEVVIKEQETQAKPKDLYGIQLATCARVMSLAKGGQILLTKAVFDSARQVLKGEDIEGVGNLSWASHGPYILKGVDEPVEVCEVAEESQRKPEAPKTSEKAHRQVGPDEEPVLGWRPAVGEAIPNNPQWVLEEKLGEGGFGEVWAAQHTKLKERRVFKFCFRADRVRTLKRELTLFRVLKEQVGEHPNIVRLLNVYLEEPPYYLEEEFVEGKDLATWCQQRGRISDVPQETKLEIIAQGAEALQAAHDSGIIHRDIKPGNILVCGEASDPKSIRVKLTDFGIGQVTSTAVLAGITQAGFTQTMLSSTSSQTGTQLYMAPELLAGKPASTRSDLYSLGVVLYQLLVGDLGQPLTGDWVENIRNGLLRDDLKLCLAGRPDERFNGAAQLAGNLRTWGQRKEQKARLQAEQAERGRLRRQVEQRRRLLRAGAAAMLALVVVAVALGYGMRKAGLERERQRGLAYASDMNLVAQALAANNLGRAQELLYRHVPAPGENDLRGWEWRYLWQQCRGDELERFCSRSRSIVSLSVSHDGKWLAVGEEEQGRLSIWDVDQGRLVTELPAGERGVCAAFSPRELLLAFSYEEGVRGQTDYRSGVRLWNGEEEKVVAELPLNGYCGRLAFSQHGNTLVTATRNKHLLTRWLVPEGTKIGEWATPSGVSAKMPGFAVNSDATLAAVAARNRLALIDLRTGRELWSVTTDNDFFTSAAFSPDGKFVVAAEGLVYTSVRFWETTTGSELGPPIRDHRVWVGDLLFLPDGKTMATASADQTIRLWDVSDPTQVQARGRPLRGHTLEVWRLAILPDQQTLVSGSKDGSVYLWDLGAAQNKGAAITLPIKATQWCFAPDGNGVLTHDTRGQVARWRGHAFDECTVLFQTSEASSWRSTFSRDGRWFASSSNGTVRIWDVERAAVVHKLDTGVEWSNPHCFLDGGRKLVIEEQSAASRSDDRPTRVDSLWDLVHTNRVQSWANPSDGAGGVLLQDESQWIRLNRNGVCSVRDLRSGRETSLELDIRQAQQQAISPDGGLYAASSWLGYVRLWETAHWREVATLRGVLMDYSSAAFTPDGTRVIAGSSGEQAIKVWSTSNFEELLTLAGRGSLFRYPRCSPDGILVGAGNQQGTLHLWRAPSFAEIATTEKEQTW